MAGKVVGTSLALALVTAAVGAVGAVGRDSATQATPVRFTASDLFIEINATDGDAGLQMDLDGEDWRSLTLRDPDGRTVMDVDGEGRLRTWGLTGMTFESAEPPFAEVPFARFKQQFPEGRYTFSGTTVDGRRLVGSDRLTHDVPDGPVLLAPTEDAVVDPAGLVVRWEPVTTPRGIEIVRYIVIVTAVASDREMSIELGPGATSVPIPAGFLERGAEHKVEVLARERGGNQTITEVVFRTSG